MKRTRRPQTKAGTYNQLAETDGAHCAYCGEYATCVDHVMPVSRGGPHTLDNMVLACMRCNLKKAAKLNMDMIARGLYVILSRGGDLSWTDQQELKRIREAPVEYLTGHQSSGVLTV